MVRALNESGGRNRLKFQKLKSRVKHARARVDVVHKVKSLDFIFDEEDDKRRGEDKSLLSKTGCLFFDHVQTCLELNTSKAFQRLGKDLAPLSRSLPEVLHHLDAIVRILTTRLKEPWGPAHENALLLVAVLAKEVGPELYPRHFRPLMDALLATLQPHDPEAASRTVQSMAHLLRALAKPVLADLDSLRRYYGPLLGHRKDFIRRYAAEALAGLLRRLGEKALGKHLKAVVRAAAAALGSNGGGNKSSEKRGGDLVDGVALLVFHVVRGIQSQGQLHSKAPPVLRALLRQEAKGAARGGDEAEESLGRVQRAVVEGALGHLCGHLKPPHAGPVWAEALAAVGAAARDEATDGLERSVHVLALLLRYRNGWLLSDEEVLGAQAGQLARVVRELGGSAQAFARLHADSQAEVVALLLALWDWRQQKHRRPAAKGKGKKKGQQQHQQQRHEPQLGEQALGAALVTGTGAVLAPESGADPDKAGELATRVLLLGGMQEQQQEQEDDDEDMDMDVNSDDEEEDERSPASSAAAASALVVDACLRRAVSPSCPPQAWAELLRALVGQAVALRRGEPALVEALGRDLVRRLGETDAGATSQMVALRCMAPVLDACGRPAALLWEAAAAAAALAVQEGEDEGAVALASMAALTLVQLWGLGAPAAGDGSSGGSSGKKKGKKQQQQQDGTGVGSRHALIAALWARLRARPASLLTVRALTEALASPGAEGDEAEAPSMDDALALLAPNLHHPSHLHRLSTLRLLTRLDALPFLAQPVGEAAVAAATAAANNKGKGEETPFVGPCPALALCLELEATPITIFVERTLGITLGRIEVMAASGRLPRAYVAPLAGYCLGMLHVRYAEVWKLAAKTFAALAQCCADAAESAAVWERALATLQEVDGRLVAAAAWQLRGQQEQQGPAPAAATAEDMDAVLVAVEAGLWGVESAPAQDDVRLVAFLLDEEGMAPSAEGQASRLGATDPLTALTWVMESLKRCPLLLGRRSAEASALFFGFLRHQYFAQYRDDPEARELEADLMAALRPKSLPEGFAGRAGSLLAPGRRLTAKLARGKLLAYLQLFAVGGVPKRGPGKELLERAFAGFLARPDGPIAAAALDCLLAQRPPHLLPYAATLRALLQDTTLRDELVRFNLSADVQPEHRPTLVPLIVRLLFGRFLAKASKARARSSKDAPAARRAAIVSFLAGAQGQAEFREFVQLMLRPFLANAARPFEAPGNLEVATASPGRRLGFLHLLRSVVRQMGFHVLPFVGAFLEVVLGLLGEGYKEAGAVEEGQEEGDHDASAGDEEDEEDGEEEDDNDDEAASSTRGRADAGRGRSQGTLRLVATRALADVVTQYAGAFDFAPAAPRLWAILEPSILRLPAMCSGARQPPALLDLLLALTQHEALLPVYARFEGTLTPTLLACLSAGQGPPAEVAGPVLSIVERLGEHDGPRFLLPYLPTLVQHLALRLQLVAQQPGGKDSLLERCLGLLCRTSLLAAEAAAAAGSLEAGSKKKKGKQQPAGVDPETLTALFGLLLPRLRSPRLLREEAKALVLQAYAALVGHMAQPRRDVMLLAKLLGPAGLGPVGFGPGGTLREALVGALTAMAERRGDCADLVPVVRVLSALNAPDEEHLEGRDLDVVMPSWTKLAEDGAWTALMQEAGGSGVALVPLVAHALAGLHDEEVVVRVAAGAGLRAAVRAAAAGAEGEWLWLLQSGLLPGLRAGVGSPKDTVRQGYVMVLTELVRAAQPSTSSWLAAHADAFHGDLGALIRADDTEADFFHNVVHIQVHRRARALQRLGKALAAASASGEEEGEQAAGAGAIAFSSATLVHILLPLASQPLLGMDKTVQAKAPDPTLLHEASVATALVARRLSWSHYHTLVRRFLREIALAEGGPAARDKALVTGLCHVLDAFHFPVAPPVEAPAAEAEEEAAEPDEEDLEGEEPEQEEGRKQPQQQKHDVVWRAVTTQLLPSLRALLLKEAKDKEGGGKVQVLRAPLALALLKLIRLLPPQAFEIELTRLLMTVCGTLRSRDSGTRDAAREVLGRMTQELGPAYMGVIIRELKAALQEGGYMLHVRIFTLHHVLRALEQVYAPPMDAPSFPVPGAMVGDCSTSPVRPPLDACLAEAVALLEDDLFGEAQGAKEAEAQVKSTAIKEAKGQRALDALEILARLLLFRPTYAVASPEDPAALSSVHALIRPFLLQLHESESPRTHGRVNEALQRVVGGLAVNPSLKAEEVLLYVYGLVSPFVLGTDKDDEEDEDGDGEGGAGSESESDSDEEEALAVIGKSGRQGGASAKQQRGQKGKGRAAATWLPVDATLKLAVEAKAVQRKAMREEARVLDGKNAPKLTGWGRHGSKQRKAEGGMFGSPAALAAGVLGLRLLHSYLKRLGTPPAALVPMIDPYVGLLARCVRRRVNDAIVLLALKSLALLLKSPAPLPSLPRMAPRLVRSSLSLLTMAGGPANSRDEVVQSCMRILTILIASAEEEEDAADAAAAAGGNGGGSSSSSSNNNNMQQLPIPAKSLGALVSLLRAAALDYDHVNAPFALIRALVNRRAMVPEMYDLMEQMLGVSVTSRRPTVRQMGAQVVVAFLLHYPLTPQRVARFLQQAVRNLGYEYEEGRAAALALLRTLVGRLPVPVLDEHAQVLFLPMVLRLVNDPAPATRAAAAEAIAALLRRVSGDVFHVLLEYQVRWMDGDSEALARAAAQAVGLFVEARPDLVKRGELGRELLRRMARILGQAEKRGPVAGVDPADLEAPRERQGEAALGWELAYHCLGSLTRVYEKVPSTVEAFLAQDPEGRGLLSAASELLCYRHAWVRLAASRLVGLYLDRRSPNGSGGGAALEASSFFLADPAEAAALARRLCVQIDRPALSPELSLRAVKSLVFLASALAHGVAASSASMQENGDDEPDEAEEQEKEQDEDDDEEGETGGGATDTLSWIFHRTSYMARRKGEDRRCAVFRFFAAMATLEGQALVRRFLPHMLGPLYRATTDGQSEASAANPENDAVELAKEVMGILEDKAGAAPYLEALSAVQKQAAAKRERRRKERAVEAVTDPEAAAKRKVAKNQMKRESEKRKKLMKRKHVGAAQARMMMRNGSGEEIAEARKRQRGLAPSEYDRDQGM